MWMITVLIFCTQFHTWNKIEGMMDYPGKAFFYHQFFNQFRSDLENGSLCSFITAWFRCSMITRLVLIMLCCVVVCARSGLCAAAVCVPAVESVWVWAHGGVDGPGRREHRRPRSNGRSTVQPGTQLRQLQVNPCLYYCLSVWCVSVSSTAEPSVSLLYFCHRL